MSSTWKSWNNKPKIIRRYHWSSRHFQNWAHTLPIREISRIKSTMVAEVITKDINKDKTSVRNYSLQRAASKQCLEPCSRHFHKMKNYNRKKSKPSRSKSSKLWLIMRTYLSQPMLHHREEGLWLITTPRKRKKYKLNKPIKMSC